MHRLMLLLLCLPLLQAQAQNPDAALHRAVADTALARAFSDLGQRSVFRSAAGFTVRTGDSVQEDLPFGALSARYAADDLSRGRFHTRGHTPLQQVQTLTAEDLRALWTAHASLPEAVPAEDAGLSVVANYLRHHYLALRWAHAAGTAGPEGLPPLRRALAYEAMAVGYLTDAFSAGHLLAPNRAGMARLQPANHRAAHRYFNLHGAFVTNLAGDVWQTLGDPLMLWYPPTRHALLQAVHWAVREVLAAYTSGADPQATPPFTRWAAALDGPAWFDLLPSLRRIPFPVTATWSIKQAQPDSFGVHPRRHFAQLRTHHDPDTEFLEPNLFYPADAFPANYLPEVLRSAPPDSLILYHPDVASVRYHQRWRYPASYKGLLLYPVAGYQVHRAAWAYGLGVGYGWWDTALLLFKNGSVDVHWLRENGPEAQDRLHLTLGGGVALPVKILDALHASAGLAFGLQGSARDPAPLFSLGLDFPTFPLGLGYTGLTIRGEYQWQWSDAPRHGPRLFLIIQ